MNQFCRIRIFPLFLRPGFKSAPSQATGNSCQFLGGLPPWMVQSGELAAEGWAEVQKVPNIQKKNILLNRYKHVHFQTYVHTYSTVVLVRDIQSQLVRQTRLVECSLWSKIMCCVYCFCAICIIRLWCISGLIYKYTKIWDLGSTPKFRPGQA